MALRRIARTRGEDGFMLVELMLALVVLTVAILALVAAFSSGYVALHRATRVSSSTLLADSQMERFRALQYTNIKLNLTCGPTPSCAEDSTYTGDAAYSSANQIGGCATTDVSCLPTQTVNGPDGKSFRMDTFVYYSCTGDASLLPAASCTAPSQQVKVVTVVVRKSTGGDWKREQSTFAPFTGS